MPKDNTSPYDDDALQDYSEEPSIYDADDEDWFNDEATDAQEPEPHNKPSPAPKTSPAPKIVSAQIDDDLDGIDDPDDLDAVDPESFGDYTARRGLFTAPRAEDVMVNPPKRNLERPKHAASAPSDGDDEQEPNDTNARTREKDTRRKTKAETRERGATQRRKEAEEDHGEEPQADDSPAPKNRRRPIIAAAGLAAVAGIGAVAFIGMNRAGDDSAVSAATNETTSAISETPEAAAPPSTEEASADTAAGKLARVVSSACAAEDHTNDDGNPNSPEGAIQGFNYAYFTAKDAEQTARFLDDGLYDSVDSLQEGIDHPDNGDAYCLQIEETDTPEQFDVEVTEYVTPDTADGEVLSWRTSQTLTLESDDGGDWRIVEQAIRSDEGND